MTDRETKLEDIRKNPRRHRHTYDGLVACCTIGGAISMQLVGAHQKHVDLGTNGGIRCDVTEGACACGAWH